MPAIPTKHRPSEILSLAECGRAVRVACKTSSSEPWRGDVPLYDCQRLLFLTATFEAAAVDGFTAAAADGGVVVDGRLAMVAVKNEGCSIKQSTGLHRTGPHHNSHVHRIGESRNCKVAHISDTNYRR